MFQYSCIEDGENTEARPLGGVCRMRSCGNTRWVGRMEEKLHLEALTVVAVVMKILEAYAQVSRWDVLTNSACS